MWSLKLIKGAELGDKLVPEVRLPEPLTRFVIGRDPASQWMLNDRTLAVSGRHCEIVPGPDGPVLHDRSTNGTFVNGAVQRMAASHVLRDGDRIEIGPFAVLVSGPPMPARAAAQPAPVPAAPPRPASVTDTRPQRGGDPAAMLAGGGGFAKVGLTEILRAAPKQEESGVDVTKIRLASARPAAPPVAPPPPAAPLPAPPPAHLAEALSRGLGVPASALPPVDLLVLAERVAAQARQASAQRGEDMAALLRRLSAP